MSKVSILMAAYNAKAFIGEAINSVIEQTYEDWELVIVDDGSSDDTLGYVTSVYGHLANIKCHSLPHNGGPSAARNVGMKVASGEWLTILDSDDRFMPERIARLVTVCEAESLDLVADNQLYYDDATKTIFQAALKISGTHVVLTPELLLRNDGPPLRFSFGALKPFIRRQFLIDNQLSYPESLRIGEDFAFLFQILSRHARAWLVPDHLYVYTVPKVRAQAASEKTRTNYGKGNIEALIETNRELRENLLPGGASRALTALFDVRQRRLSCALALRDIRELSPARAARRLLQERGWQRFFIDKVRNVFQRSHTVRGHR